MSVSEKKNSRHWTLMIVALLCTAISLGACEYQRRFTHSRGDAHALYRAIALLWYEPVASSCIPWRPCISA